LENAFRAFGGVTATLVPDNLVRRQVDDCFLMFNFPEIANVRKQGLTRMAFR